MKLKRNHNQNREFIVDTTPAELNINFRSKKVSKESLEDKDYAWGWVHQLDIILDRKSH